MSSSSFRVIVVGGGPVGLAAAHALGKAGIDFLVLERRPEIVMDVGSNVVMSPVGLRAMAQLDLLERLNRVSSPLGDIDRLDHSGANIGDLQIFHQIKALYGLAPRVISRHDLMKVLYESLSAQDQQKLLCNKKFVDIKPTADGVVVSCTDGSSYRGSMVIGADGAHSAVRDVMRTMSLNAGGQKLNAEKPFLTTYRALWVRFPRNSSLPDGMTCETHGPTAATQFFVGENSGVVGLYERLETPTRERVRYTQQDQDSLVDRWGHLFVTPDRKFTLRDVYTSRLESGLVSLEEGTLDHWSWDGRVVLAGDAAHKFTPTTGAGWNNGMIDIVALVNELYITRQSSPAASSDRAAGPDPAQLQAAFTRYQTTRQSTVAAECTRASQATAMATWQSGVHKFFDRRVLAFHLVQSLLISSGANDVARTPACHFNKGQAVPNGTVPWIPSYAPPPVRV